jgi:hypothetical protein
MNKNLPILVFILLLPFSLKAQTKEFYASSSFEIILSWADVTVNNESDGNIIRFAPVFNFQSLVNYDFSKSFGLFSGLGVRNVGFIYQLKKSNGEDTVRKKFRTYNLGIPVGFKIGNLERFHFYGGYEFEWAFNYKEKTFDGGAKTEKFVVWFGNRNTPVVHSLFAGFQFPYGGNLKFKYYLTNFHNQSFKDASGNQPYADITANVFYISLNFFLFKNTDLYYKNYYKEKEVKSSSARK